jgi:hypothetical protein
MKKYFDEKDFWIWGHSSINELKIAVKINGNSVPFIVVKTSPNSDSLYIKLHDVFDRLEKKTIEQVISFTNDFLITKFLKNLEKYLAGSADSLITVKTIAQVFCDKLETYGFDEPTDVKIHKRTDDEFVAEVMNSWDYTFKAYYKDANTISVSITNDDPHSIPYFEEVDVRDDKKLREVYKMMDSFLESQLIMWYDTEDNPPRYGDWVDYR